MRYPVYKPGEDPDEYLKTVLRRAELAVHDLGKETRGPDGLVLPAVKFRATLAAIEGIRDLDEYPELCALGLDPYPAHPCWEEIKEFFSATFSPLRTRAPPVRRPAEPAESTVHVRCASFDSCPDSARPSVSAVPPPVAPCEPPPDVVPEDDHSPLVSVLPPPPTAASAKHQPPAKQKPPPDPDDGVATKSPFSWRASAVTPAPPLTADPPDCAWADELLNDLDACTGTMPSLSAMETAPSDDRLCQDAAAAPLAPDPPRLLVTCLSTPGESCVLVGNREWKPGTTALDETPSPVAGNAFRDTSRRGMHEAPIGGTNRENGPSVCTALVVPEQPAPSGFHAPPDLPRPMRPPTDSADAMESPQGCVECVAPADAAPGRALAHPADVGTRGTMHWLDDRDGPPRDADMAENRMPRVDPCQLHGPLAPTAPCRPCVRGLRPPAAPPFASPRKRSPTHRGEEETGGHECDQGRHAAAATARCRRLQRQTPSALCGRWWDSQPGLARQTPRPGRPMSPASDTRKYHAEQIKHKLGPSAHSLRAGRHDVSRANPVVKKGWHVAGTQRIIDRQDTTKIVPRRPKGIHRHDRSRLNYRRGRYKAPLRVEGCVPRLASQATNGHQQGVDSRRISPPGTRGAPSNGAVKTARSTGLVHKVPIIGGEQMRVKSAGGGPGVDVVDHDRGMAADGMSEVPDHVADVHGRCILSRAKGWCTWQRGCGSRGRQP
ncbi:hypothetical protein BC831DRAFT_462234 [Entophlyctis helioformis]|nr:hypothetical protein BC831DRAFT_462234 [Entophlyctis helioformis]